MSLRVKDDDEGGEDGTLATTANRRNGQNKEEEEKKCSLMRKMFHRWHISALTKKRNEQSQSKIEEAQKFTELRAVADAPRDERHDVRVA